MGFEATTPPLWVWDAAEGELCLPRLVPPWSGMVVLARKGIRGARPYDGWDPTGGGSPPVEVAVLLIGNGQEWPFRGWTSRPAFRRRPHDLTLHHQR